MRLSVNLGRVTIGYDQHRLTHTASQPLKSMFEMRTIFIEVTWMSNTEAHRKDVEKRETKMDSVREIVYWPLLRFFSALARTPPKTNIVALLERNSGKSD